MYYRYELWMGDDDMGVGFIEGVDEMDVDPEVAEKLVEPFDLRLPMPPSDVFAGHKRCLSWFTQQGRDEFASEIGTLVTAYGKDGFYDVVERTAESLDGIVYEDGFQVLTASSYDEDPNLERTSWRIVSE